MNPAKPMYAIADEAPLVLHECGFDNLNMFWQPSVLWSLTGHFEALYDRYMIAASRALNSIQFLRKKFVREKDRYVSIAFVISGVNLKSAQYFDRASREENQIREGLSHVG